MSAQSEYHFNFFKPHSDYARSNQKLIGILATIWALAVFGFHFLLIFTTIPTPEATLTQFETTWPQVYQVEHVSLDAQQDLGRSLLMVLGKNIVLKDDHRVVLSSGLTYVVQSLRDDSIVGNTTPTEAKLLLGLGDEGFDQIMTDLLPLALATNSVFSDADAIELPKIMALYLTHNESFLTRARFMGFPFHYWYTAQFLLILFVVLCIIYAVSIDRLNAKYGLTEDSHHPELGA